MLVAVRPDKVVEPDAPVPAVVRQTGADECVSKVESQEDGVTVVEGKCPHFGPDHCRLEA